MALSMSTAKEVRVAAVVDKRRTGAYKEAKEDDRPRSTTTCHGGSVLCGRDDDNIMMIQISSNLEFQIGPLPDIEYCKLASV
jgi:hypothetical protein